MLRTSLLRAAVLMAVVFAAASAAQAMGDAGWEPADETGVPPSDARMSPERLNSVVKAPSLDDLLGDGQPEPGDPGHGGTDPTIDEARRTAEQWRSRADGTVKEAQQTVDLEGLQRLAMDEVRGAQQQVADAQEQLGGVLPVEEEAGQEDQPASEPTMAPQGQTASIWDGLQAPVLLVAGTAAGFGLLGWLIGQSATVGAGAAGTAAARGRKFIPYASPLFTRFEKDTVLGHPKREAIYGEIVEKPGVTLQDLCETTGLSRTAVTHHLRLMEQQHLVVSKRVGRSRHFFENGGRYGRDQKEAYAVLHNDRSKDIHGFIRKNPGAIQKDLCAAFGIQASVAHWHVKRLLEANLVEAIRQGRTVSYFPSTEVAEPAYA